MTRGRAGSPRLYRRLALSALVATLALIALGGVVRITGSGMACGDDWPLCQGRLLPPLDLPTLIEYSHRLSAALLSALVCVLLLTAWTRHRREGGLRLAATWAAGLLLLQVLLGAVTVRVGLLPGVVVLHLATAMLLLGALTVAVARAWDEESTGGALMSEPVSITSQHVRYLALVRVCAVVAFITIVMGGLVANLNAGPACRGFPLCNGTMIPEGETRVWIHFLHRLVAFLLLGLLVVLFAASRMRGRRLAAGAGARNLLAGAVLALALAQIAVAAAMVLHFLPDGLRALHMLLGALVWTCLVGLHELALRAPAEAQRLSVGRLPRRPRPVTEGRLPLTEGRR